MAKLVGSGCATFGPAAIGRVARVLAEGGVAVLPTDTVYGIAQSVDANPGGAARLFEIKRRDPAKSVAWLVADPSALDRYGRDVPPYARRLARAFWPGGLTIAVRAADGVAPAWLGPGGTVALRMPDSPEALAVIRSVGCPLATTSANTSGLAAPASFGELEARIVDEADVVLIGDVPCAGLASTVVVCDETGPRVVREGAIPEADLLAAI